MNGPSKSRPIVDFLIVGAQKAGTTAAAFNLAKHPKISLFQGVTSFGQREIEFFNQHWNLGQEWYQSHFDYGKEVVGEKTAELLHRTITHRRIHATAPGAKLIVLLRCPVERAYSQWKMATRQGWGEYRNFSDVVTSELARLDDPEERRAVYECSNRDIQPWREGYLLKGLYITQLSSLLEWYSREQLYIAIAERVRRNMAAEYCKMFDFLGIEPLEIRFEEKFVGSPAQEMDVDLRAQLAALYGPYNERLFDLLGYRIQEWAV